MALPTWYSTGTVSVESGSTTVTATGAFWGEDAVMVGDLFCDPAQPLVPPQRVKEVTGAAELELWAPWPGTDMTDDPYEIRYVGMIERSTAQTRKVLEQLGEVSAYFDIQVDTLADRDAFDSRPSGYRVLVSDIGDGRAAIYSKASSVDEDWSDPAYFSGPVGPVGPTGDTGPVGIIWTAGNWDSDTTYALNNGTRDNGSSWRSLQNGNLNHPPPTLPTTSNAWWELIAAKGTDGTGTGDVVGPASSANNRVAAFDGTTGKLIKDGGKTVAELTPAYASKSEMQAASVADKSVPPNLTIHHPGVAKVWGIFGPSGNLLAGYGIASIVDDGTGLVTVQYSNAFASSNYAANATCLNTAGAPRWVTIVSQNTASITLRADNLAAAAADPMFWELSIHGTLP